MQQKPFVSELIQAIRLTPAWIGFLYLPVLIQPDEAPALYVSIILLAALIAGGLVLFVCRLYYRDIHRETSRFFSVSLLSLSFLSTLITYRAVRWPGFSILAVFLLTILSSRSIIRNKVDILFVCWAACSGLLIGVGLVGPTLILNGLAFLSGFLLMRRRLARTQYRLIIRCDKNALTELNPLLSEIKAREVSRTEQDGQIDLTLKVALRNASLKIVDQALSIQGVQQAVMLLNDDKDDGCLSDRF